MGHDKSSFSVETQSVVFPTLTSVEAKLPHALRY